MKLLKKCKVALPPLIVLAVYAVVLFIKKIYPFGNLTVDYYDMAQQISAFYYHIYDVLHGEKALFLDPYTALSVNMAMSTSGCSHLSIFNLFFLFVKRNMLLESLSYFLLMKMMFMSITMYIYLSKRRKLSFLSELMFSTGYAFCGFVMVLYVTIQWMDLAILFPLLMLFMHDVIEKGKSLPYVIILSLSMISSYYITFMMLIFIVLILGLELSADYIFEKKEDRQKNKYNFSALLYETVISILISAFIVIPQLKQTLMSARFNNESGGGILGMYKGIIATITPAYTTRWFTLLGLSFAFAVICTGIIKNRKDHKFVYLAIGTLFIMLSELFIESVNLIWHFGSYVQYPIRNGFIIYFAVVMTAASFLEKEEIRLSGFSHIVIASVILFTALCLGIRKYVTLSDIPVRSLFHILAVIMAATFLVYTFLLNFGKGKLLGMAPSLLIAEVILYCFIFIGHPTFITGYSEEPEQEGEYIRICNQLSTAFDIKPADDYSHYFSRIKNPDESLNANYGLCLRRPALSNWTHLLDPALSDTAKKLGYSVQFTRLLDAGGTVFTDALLSIENVVSYIPQNEELYTLVGEADIEIDHISKKRRNYYFYESKYTLPFGTLADDISSVDFDADGDLVDLYNDIYRSVSGDDEGKIAKWIYNNDIQHKRYEERNGNIRRINQNFDILGKQALYYFADQVDRDDYNTTINVNGESILIPSIKEWNNTLYPAHFNSNAVFLGVFDSETVNINVEYMDYVSSGAKIDAVFDPNILGIDIDVLEKMCKSKASEVTRDAGRRGYHFGVNAKNGEELFIPISFDNGYYAYVNGKKVDVQSVGSMFISVPLNEGANEVTVRFVPDGMIMGSIISLIALIVLVCFVYLERRNKVHLICIPFIEVIYLLGWSVVMLLMYIIPIVYGVIKCIA